MQCPNCLARITSVNGGAETRCPQCGRRLHPSAPRHAPEGYVSAATAPALEAIPGGLSHTKASLPERLSKPVSQPVYQPSLFRDVLTGAKVIPIPTLTPL